MIKTAAQILAELGQTVPDPELARPLKAPNRHGTYIRTNRYPVTRKTQWRKNRLCELVPGCTRPHKAHGGCVEHEYRQRKWGSPTFYPSKPVDLGHLEGVCADDCGHA